MDGLITKKNSFRAKNGKNFKKRREFLGQKWMDWEEKVSIRVQNETIFKTIKKWFFVQKMDILIRKKN